MRSVRSDAPAAQALVDAVRAGPALDPARRAPDAPGRAEPPFCAYPVTPEAPTGWTQRVPEAVVSALLDPGRMLVVGDAPGDPDCFCSAVAVARARRALFLPADAHVDAPAPQQVQGMLRPEDLASPDAVRASGYDTVLFVDNDGGRVGPAARAAAADAKRVVVIDHHEVDPTHETLGLRPDADLVRWIDTGADAAALMSLAAILRAADRSGAVLFQSTWKDVLEPIVGAVYSDTRGFEAARAGPATVGLLHSVLATGAVDLKATLRGFGGGIPGELRRALAAEVSEREEVVGGASVGTFSLSGEALLDVWARARAHSPELTWSDMLFCALDHVEARTREADHDVTLFAVGDDDPGARAALPEALRAQLPPKATKFSVRTKDGDLAPRLAAHLGGGGKPHEGGGVSDERPEAIASAARRYLQAQADLRAEASLRNLGGV